MDPNNFELVDFDIQMHKTTIEFQTQAVNTTFEVVEEIKDFNE